MRICRHKLDTVRRIDMKALARYGKEFGGYRFIDLPESECGDEDIIVKIKAAAI